MRVLFLSLFLAVSSQAQQYDRLLLPVVVEGEIAGDFGSRWTSNLALTNVGESPLGILGYQWAPGGCGIATCPPPPRIPMGVTFYPILDQDDAEHGAILLVDSARARDLRVQLRIRDRSRSLETWGTELPVVNATTLPEGPISLLDVPIDPAFRLTLRVYDLNAIADARVLVRAWSTNDAVRSPVDPLQAPPAEDAMIAERQYSLTTARHDDPRYDVSYLQASDVSELGSSPGRIRLEITPLSSGSRLWAFMTVTNNATQHVTTITPQP